MQYADIAVTERIGLGDRLFTYAIPPEFLPAIAVGVIVDVPFRNTHVPGVVCGLRPRLPDPTLASRLRPIRRVISPWPLLGLAELRLRQSLADETINSLATTVTLLLPPPSLYRRLATPVPDRTERGTITWRLGQPAAELISLTPKIADAIAKNLVVLILTPTKNLAKDVIELFRPKLPSCLISHFDRGMSVTELLPAWQIALGNTPGVIVGTRSAVLLPIRQPGLIIILEPSDRQFEEGQTPHYQTFRVAELRHELFGADIIGITPLPPLAFMVGARRRATRMRRTDTPIPKILVTQRVAGPRLGTSSQNLISRALKNRESVAIIVPQRGWAAGLVCQECNTIMRCEHCGQLLRVGDSTGRLMCQTCLKSYQIDHCPSCQSVRLYGFGWGSDQWLVELKKSFPTAVLATTNQDEPLPDHWQLLVSLPERFIRSLVVVDQMVVFEPERLLSAGDYRANERFMRMLLELRSRTNKTLLIETATPNLPILSELGMILPKTTLNHDLTLRQRYHYPPFGRLWRITTNFNSNLIHKIRTFLPDAELIGPGTTTNDRGHTLQELLIKLPTIKSNPKLNLLRRNLPRNSRLRLE